ncbi:hypothetical protein ACIB24_04215 [Spongisporangium articulatum]|uniref:Uncharacterized protein n=1 Tax=Spongisporangium articulatum TaxID=3362603 RepID=A0ABW8AIQ9_9ACTN
MIGRVVVDLALFGLFALLLTVAVCVVLVGWQERTNRQPPAAWVAAWNARAEVLQARELPPLAECVDEVQALFAEPATAAAEDVVPDAEEPAALDRAA